MTLLRPTQRVEIFGNNFAPRSSLETWAVRIKILGEIQKVLGDRANLIEGGIGVFQLISRFISKTIQSTAIVTMRSIEYCHFQ